MKRLLIGLLLVLVVPCVAQKKAQPEILKVRIEATESDKKFLLDKLNAHGSGHQIQFEGAGENYTYRMVFSTGQEVYPTAFGGMNSSAATVKVFDAKGTELFDVKRAGRGTDARAANAVAKEIVKRLVQLRSQTAK